MSSLSFYSSKKYRSTQRKITLENIALGKYNHLKKREHRECARVDCRVAFTVRPYESKRYCSNSCAAKARNLGRKLSSETKARIGNALKGRSSPLKGALLVPRESRECTRETCRKVFQYERYKNRKFCSNNCSFAVTSSQPTSPKASRGKSGIRPDIDSKICFFSRWEANVARYFNYIGTDWEFAPRTFDLGGQRYTPDFYLPETDTYVEVKNFWNEYSRARDEKFRKRYPDLKLKVLLKEEYLRIESDFSARVPNWEYRNSPYVSGRL